MGNYTRPVDTKMISTPKEHSSQKIGARDENARPDGIYGNIVVGNELKSFQRNGLGHV